MTKAQDSACYIIFPVSYVLQDGEWYNNYGLVGSIAEFTEITQKPQGVYLGDRFNNGDY